MKFRTPGNKRGKPVFGKEPSDGSIYRRHIFAKLQPVYQPMDKNLIFFIGFHNIFMCSHRILRGQENISPITSQGSEEE